MRFHRLAAIALMLTGAACTSSSYDVLETASISGTTTASFSGPRFGDHDPWDWTGKTPWHYRIHGTDVSKYQGHIDWPRARGSGISFAFIKATEGGDILDEKFMRNWASAKNAGVARGAYHFYYFCTPAAQQAKWFIRNVPRDAHALPPVLDMEWNHASPTCKRRPPANVVWQEMKTFLDIVTRHYGKTPIVYTTPDFFDTNQLNRMSGVHFWLRSTAGHPDEKYGDHPWLFWQYTGTGKVPGIDGKADLNVFSGSNSEWRKWLTANSR